MVLHFQYGNGIYLRSALIALGRQFAGSYAEWKLRSENPDSWRHFHKVSDVCEARFRTRSAGDALERALDVAMRSTRLTVEKGLELDTSHTGHWYDLYTTTLSSSSGRPLRWYDGDGLSPRDFPTCGWTSPTRPAARRRSSSPAATWKSGRGPLTGS